MIPRYALGNWWSRYYKYTEESYRELIERFEFEKILFLWSMIWTGLEKRKRGSGWTG